MTSSAGVPAGAPSLTPRARTRWSVLAGRPVFDASGARIGWIEDATAMLDGRDRPLLTALVVRTRRSAPRLRLRLDGTTALAASRITMRDGPKDVPMPAGEVLVKADILGHRLIDRRTARFVHARDLESALYDEGWVLDRVELGRPGRRPRGTLRIVDWPACAPLVGHAPSRDARRRLLQRWSLRPEQIAGLLEQATDAETPDLLDSVEADPDAEAAAFELLVPSHAGRLLGTRPDREIAAVLTLMRADTAAHVVAAMPPERQGRVIQTLTPDARGAVSAMLGDRPGTAGTVMRTDIFAAPVTADVESTRRHVVDQDRLDIPRRGSVYLVDGHRRLAGVVTTAALIAAPAGGRLTALADVDPVAVRADAGLVDVAELMADRHLVAVPVVDHTGAVLGVVTADDVLGVLTVDRRRRGEQSLLP